VVTLHAVVRVLLSVVKRVGAENPVANAYAEGWDDRARPNAPTVPSVPVALWSGMARA
jgi:hypothetical protein